MEDRMLAYDASHVLARMFLEQGLTPVLECTYARRRQRSSLLEAIADLPDAPLWVVEFFVSTDEAVQRFRSREQETDLDEILVREHVETFPYSDMVLRLPSAAATPNDLASQIVEWLQGAPEPVHRDLWVEAGKA
jgi:predicted kinase